MATVDRAAPGVARAGRIDLLVNNAGVGLIGAAEESSLEQAKSIFDVNLFGAIRMTKAVLPLMRQQRFGRIINISSVLGLIPAPFSALYASTKYAIEGYSESLDHEVRGSGIRVVLVEPAYTRTGFDTNALVADQKNDHYAPARANAEAVFRAVMTTADSPDVVADAVVTAATTTTPRLRYTAGSMARKVVCLDASSQPRHLTRACASSCRCRRRPAFFRAVASRATAAKRLDCNHNE